MWVPRGREREDRFDVVRPMLERGPPFLERDAARDEPVQPSLVSLCERGSGLLVVAADPKTTLFSSTSSRFSAPVSTGIARLFRPQRSIGIHTRTTNRRNYARHNCDEQQHARYRSKHSRVARRLIEQEWCNPARCDKRDCGTDDSPGHR